jgi:hypothetical protein
MITVFGIRLRFWQLAIGVVGFAGATIWLMDLRARSALAAMCAVDGGLRITETVYAHGYLDETFTENMCPTCIEAVGTGQFEYVDVQSKAGGDFYFKTPGYYRISLSNKGDPNCDAYLTAKQEHLDWALRVPSQYGLQPTVCFAVDKLADRPKGYIYSSGFRRGATRHGPTFGIAEQFIRYEPSGKILAVNRDYLYASWATLHLDMSGGGGRTDATCSSAYQWRFHSAAMRTRILRDDSKKIEEQLMNTYSELYDAALLADATYLNLPVVQLAKYVADRE